MGCICVSNINHADHMGGTCFCSGGALPVFYGSAGKKAKDEDEDKSENKMNL